MSDINASAIVSYVLRDGTKGTFESPANSLADGIASANYQLNTNIGHGETEYVGYKITGAKWGVPSNWLGV